MRLICPFLFLLGTAGSMSAQQPQGPLASQVAQTVGAVTFASRNITPLKAIVQIASENGVPLGIILGTHPFLCSERSLLKIDAANLKDAFSQALAGTGYRLEIQGSVYVLVAPDTTPLEDKLLAFRFDRFRATDSTMSDAGALLAGYIASVAEGAKGFAFDSISRTAAKRFTFQMLSATTTEIANHIVTLDGKGLWLFRPTPDKIPGPESVTPIQIYAYGDDSGDLERLTCVGSPIEAVP